MELTVLEGLKVEVKLDVAEFVEVDDSLIVLVADQVGLMVEVTEIVSVALGSSVGVQVGEIVDVGDVVAVKLAVREGLSLGLCVNVAEMLGVRVGVPVSGTWAWTTRSTDPALEFRPYPSCRVT